MSARQRRWLISSKKELHLDCTIHMHFFFFSSRLQVLLRCSGPLTFFLARRLGNLEAREIAEELSADNDTHDLWLGRACHLLPLSRFLLLHANAVAMQIRIASVFSWSVAPFRHSNPRTR